MCIPTAVIAGASLAATAVSGVMKAKGAAEEAKGQQANLRAAANTAETNAQIAETNGAAGLKMADINSTLVLRIASNQADATKNLGALNNTIAEAAAGAAEAEATTIEGTAKINADRLELQAEDTYAMGQRKAQGVQLSASALKGSQRASLAANGVALDADTSLRLLTSTDVMADRQIDAIHMQAIKEAMGYRTEAVSQTLTATMKAFNERAKAAMTRSAGQAGLVGADIEAENLLLGAKTAALGMKQDAETAAMNARIQALGLTNQARAANESASRINPSFIAATSLIGSAGQVASKWYSYNKEGVFG